MTGSNPTAMQGAVGGKRHLVVTLAGAWLLTAAGLGLLVVLSFVGNNQQVAVKHVVSTPTSMLTTQPPSLKLLWKYDTGYYKEGTPIIADGVLYAIVSEVGDYGCLYYHGGWCYHLQALDIATGKMKWTLDDYEYPPTVANRMVYSGWGGELHAIDIGTHQVKWKFKTEDVTKDEPFVTNAVKFAPTVADGVVYFGSGGTLYALYADTGVEMWRVKYADEIGSSPVISANIIYIIGDFIKMPSYTDVIFRQNNLFAVRKENGQQLWKFEPPPGDGQTGAVGNLVVAVNGTVYCTSTYTGPDDPGYVYAFDGKTGQQLWKHSPGGGLNPFTSPVVPHKGLLYITDGRDNLYALDARNGEEQWQFTSGELTAYGPVIVGERIHIANVNGDVFGVDAETGKETSRYRTGKDYYLDTVAANRDVYFVGRHPRDIYMFALPR